TMLVLGKVTLDRYEAVVGFEDWSSEHDLYRVTVSVRKPRTAPAIDARRIRVWVLRWGYDEQLALPPSRRPTGQLPEEGDGPRVTATAVFDYCLNQTDTRIEAVVVAVDGEPTAFRPPRDAGGIAPRVFPAWWRLGFSFGLRWLDEDHPRYAAPPPGGEGA